MTPGLAVTLGLSHGFMSSLHCIAMCGPLLTALKVNPAGSVKSGTVLRYNLARMSGYAVLGAILGGAGFSAEAMLISGAAVIFGSVILMVSASLMLWPSLLHKIPAIRLPVYKLARGSAFKPEILGFLTALMPCSVLYPAYAIAIAIGSVWAGSLAMLAFAAGTMLTMVVVPVISGKVPSVLAGISWRRPAAFMLVLYSLFLLSGRWHNAPELVRNLPDSTLHGDNCR